MSDISKIADRLYRRYVANAGMVDESIAKLKILKNQLRENPNLESEVLEKMRLIEIDLDKYKKEFKIIKKEWNKANASFKLSRLEEDNE